MSDHFSSASPAPLVLSVSSQRRSERLSWFAALVLGLALFAMPQCALCDEAEVREFLKRYADAFNKADVDAAAAMWTENATHLDRATGVRTEGRAAILGDLKQSLTSPNAPHLAGQVDHVRLITPDVASVSGVLTTSIPDETPVVSSFIATLVKQDDAWKIDAVEESPLATPTEPGAALVPLAWLEGSWVDNASDASVVSTFRWSSNRTFLIRSIAEVVEGNETPVATEVVGWDPRAGVIRSWSFHADGSFGSSVWSRADDEWVIKTIQTLADGSAASGTYLLKPVDANTATIKLIGREIDGVAQPNSDLATITRVSTEEGTVDSAATSSDTGADTPTEAPAPAPGSKGDKSDPGAAPPVSIKPAAPTPAPRSPKP